MPNLQLSFGPMLIGVFLNLILFGILIMQTCIYFQTYRRCAPFRLLLSVLMLSSDSKWIKLFVLYLFVVETANSIFNMAMIYQPLIAEWGTLTATQYFPTLFVMEPIATVMVSTPIQLFFAWRIKKITKTIWIPLVILSFSLGSTAGGLWTGIRIPILKLFVKKPLLHWSALVWLLSSCISDALITVALVRSLTLRKTGFDLTDSVIDKIIRILFWFSNSADCAICAIGDVAFFMALPHTALLENPDSVVYVCQLISHRNFIFDMALSKSYTNCLMSTLNSRASLNNMSGGVSGQRNVIIADGTLASRRRTRDMSSEGGHSRSYELEPPTKAYQQDIPFGPRDVEYGITVTKVVEQHGDIQQ
ncbi:hypothetical protein C8J56DRAFT_1167453 [Mycena floridula]|nr:hypothetical protein C8J56DRAFT_1167453 [Mycena floridula]